MRHRTRDRTFFGSRPSSCCRKTRTETIVLRTKRDGHECSQDATQTKARTNPPAFYRKKTISSSSRNPTQNLLSSLTYIYRKLNERRRRSTDSSILQLLHNARHLTTRSYDNAQRGGPAKFGWSYYLPGQLRLHPQLIHRLTDRSVLGLEVRRSWNRRHEERGPRFGTDRIRSRRGGN